MSYSFSSCLEELKKLGLVNLRVVEVNGETKTELLNKSEIPVRNNYGFLCGVDPVVKMQFAIITEVERRSGLYAFEVIEKQRKIQVLNDKDMANPSAIFVKSVPTHPDKKGNHVTKNNDFQNNGFYFASINDSQLTMWEICIVTDVKGGYSRYYLSLQKTYQAGMYNNDGKLIIPEKEFPGYKDWHGLQDFLADTVNLKVLRPWSDYQWPKEVDERGLKANEARIIFFNQSRRYGLGKVAKRFNPAMIHASEIFDGEFPALNSGQICTFERMVETAPGKFQLKGVRPVAAHSL